MKRPLSFTRYLISNAKMSIAMTFALSLSVMMILIFQTITFAVSESGRIGDVTVVEHLTKVYPGNVSDMPKEVKEKLENDSTVANAIPVRMENMDYHHIFGTCNTQAFFVSPTYLSGLMEQLNFTLYQGRLPKEGAKEILLSEKLAANKGLKLGDQIGKAVNANEKLPGSYTIVGIIKGPSMLGLGFLESSEALEVEALLLIPKSDQLTNMNRMIRSISEEQVGFWDIDKANVNYEASENTLNTIFGVLSMSILFVMAFAAGNASYSHYFSRRYEFGLLQSMGYTRRQILTRVTKEIVFLNLFSLFLGFLLGFILIVIMKVTIFDPKGYPFVYLQTDGLLKATSILLCTTLFGLIPAGWLLSKVNPMIIIEKFEG